MVSSRFLGTKCSKVRNDGRLERLGVARKEMVGVLYPDQPGGLGDALEQGLHLPRRAKLVESPLDEQLGLRTALDRLQLPAGHRYADAAQRHHPLVARAYRQSYARAEREAGH